MDRQGSGDERFDGHHGGARAAGAAAPRPSPGAVPASPAHLETGNLLAFAAGVCTLWLWPARPASLWLSVLVLSALALLALGSLAGRLRPLAGGGLARCSAWSGECTMSVRPRPRLPWELEEDLLVVGTVADLPRSMRCRALRVLSGQASHGAGRCPWPAAGAWAGTCQAPRWEPRRWVLPGQRWQLTVRLKRPRGMRNPGGFDSGARPGNRHQCGLCP